jgi:DDB1- and CUL4-associated factor 7
MELNKEEELGLNLNFESENYLPSSHHEKSKYDNSEYIKTYTSNYKLYGLSFQNDKTTTRLALSTIETTDLREENRIEVVEYMESTDRLKKITSEKTDFPCSKIQWSPNNSNNSILATTSDILRLYKYNESSQKLSLACSLTKKQSQNYSGPLTSMDWNKQNPTILGVCSVDTTVAIWDLTKNEVKMLLIAHDKEVYDMSFGKDENVFLTTGADGSIRMFDTRSLDTCSILFESQDNSPITRIAWNYNDPNFVAALLLDKNFIYIIDQRMTNTPYAFLTYHTNVVNALSWAPHSNAYITSVGDDKNAFIWDIQMISNRTEEPVMSYNSEFEIDNVSWSDSHDEWIGITGSNILQMLKIK